MQEVAKFADVDLVGGEPVGPEEYADFARVDAFESYLRHAFDALEPPLQQPVQQFVAVGQVARARYAQVQNRLVAERSRENENPLDVFGQLVANAVDLGAGLYALGAHALVPAELQEDLRLALVGRREHPFHARQGRERLFDGPRDQALDLFRCRSRVGHLDEDAGKLDVGEFLERQEPGRDEADERERHEGNDGSYRSAQRELGVLHRRRSSSE